MTPVEQDPDRLDVLGYFGPYPAGLIMGYPVSTAVNRVAHDGPGLVEPLGQVAHVVIP
jgi:hypothetical protein